MFFLAWFLIITWGWLLLFLYNCINNLIKYLKNHNLLPCLFFIFSRKKCFTYAKSVTISLNTPEEQAKVEKIIETYLRKLNNYDVYLNNNQLRIGGLLFAIIGFIVVWYFKWILN